jgi:hypothetical protein
MAIKRFAEFSDEPIGLDGDKIQLDRILNSEILITGYRILTSKYPDKNKSGKALQLQFKVLKHGTDDNDIRPNVLFTGSDVLIDQITKYSEHIPIYAQIIKINRYYSFR